MQREKKGRKKKVEEEKEQIKTYLVHIYSLEKSGALVFFNAFYNSKLHSWHKNTIFNRLFRKDSHNILD